VSSPTSIRLLVAEDVPQVSQHVRNLLSMQSQVKLLEVLNDGSKVVDSARQLRPDVVMVDLLLQGKVKGPQLIEKLRDSGLDIPVVVLTVPQHPLTRDPARGIDAVLTLPFSGFELVNTLSHVLADRQARSAGACRVISVFSPKGGVGKTTIAFNLAVSMGQLGVPTALIDGSLQYGDLRALLKVPSDVPSILDLPTDRVQESDLRRSCGAILLVSTSCWRRARRREDDLAAPPVVSGNRHRHAHDAVRGDARLPRRV
jgi:CheY-like chemotaxis protein